MVARLIHKNEAIELRKQGMTYSEIAKIVPVNKGLLLFLFKDLPFTQEERERIASKIVGSREKGILKSSMTNKQKRLGREIVAFEDAKKMFMEMKDDRRFLIGIALYWAEGAKKHNVFQFVNSDPDMIVFMCKWVRKYLNIKDEKIKYRLFTYKIPGHENIGIFWANKLGIKQDFIQKTIFKPNKHNIEKSHDYKGCMRLSISNVYTFRLMKAWQKLLIQYYDDAPSW